MSRSWVRLNVWSVLFVVSAGQSVEAAGWKAGVAKVPITPKESVWMAGYGSRDKPSEGALHDLWAKALVLEDPAGKKAAIVSLDVCGIDRSLSKRLREAMKQSYGLTEDRIVLACSHTHCGPVVGENLITMYKLDREQERRVADYTAFFEKSVLTAVEFANGRLEPAKLAWDTGKADFAVNRRTNKEPEVPALREKGTLAGPVDHDVPVLRILGDGADKSVRAVVFGYACHCTVLSFNQFCGDYAGFAQIALERQYPNAQALFVAGCGADQNPLPRRTVELAEKYGNELAAAVQHVVDSPMRPITAPLVAAYEEIPLRFGTLPIRSEISEDAKSSNYYIASRARKLLRTFDRAGKLDSAYPYPLQVWRIDELNWFLLGGEVVVDYSLRFKRNFGSSHTWVSGYCNDVMAYIPSLRVLKEGGYEGATAMIYYGLPTSWSDDVENQISDGINRLVKSIATKP